MIDLSKKTGLTIVAASAMAVSVQGSYAQPPPSPFE